MERRDEDGVEAAAIAALVPLDGKRVLEVGCGKGRLTALAAARASSVYAFDPNAANVATLGSPITSCPIATLAQSLSRTKAVIQTVERSPIT